ncbi:MAG: 50S ribosomal protein L21e [Candidatus Bathyarchaeia archaeon]
MTGLSPLIRRYRVGERVVIRIDRGVHAGMPHRRYQGRVGTIVEERGSSYVVEIAVGKRKVKKIISRPEHLKSVH